MATNRAFASYQEVIDLSTTDGTLSIIGIHTPVGSAPWRMLEGFWKQFRFVRYKGCTLRMVNAAQLPADPLQLSYDTGTTIDPRDMLNPILFHGAHGETLNEVLDTIYKASGFDWASSSMENSDFPFDIQLSEQAYYSALSDPTFKKFGIQQVIKLNMYPMVHKMALSSPVVPNPNSPTRGYVVADPDDSSMFGFEDLPGKVLDSATGTGDPVWKTQYMSMLTNGATRLGWMPTRIPRADAAAPAQYTGIPKLFMGCLILPPSYKCELYFRAVLTHHFEFRGFSTALSPGNNVAVGPQEYYNRLPESATASTSLDDESTTSLEVVNARYDVTTSGVF